MRGSMLARKPRGNVESKSFVLAGGLNLVDAPLTIPRGMCLSAVNYELLTTDGYHRVDGFERFDGQDSPSEATYWILNYDNGVGAISEGDIVTGLSSGETGKALIDQVGTVAAGYLVLTNVGSVGFTDGEDLQVSAVTKADADGTEDVRGASTPALDATYVQDAIETQRALVLAVGAGDGSGKIRGVHVFLGDTYAFRDNAAATACLMYKNSTAGWVLQALGNRLPFTDAGAGVAYVEGETITGTTSSATAVIARVVLQSGAWGVDAVGYLIIGDVTNGPFQAEATTGSVAGAVPIDSAEVANTLSAGGRFEFVNDNFFGSTATQRMYGVDGVSPAFEFDGTTFVPILTGNVVDIPFHLETNEFHLHLSFANGSLQNSATGNPYIWAGGGAAEIGVGQEIVGLLKEVGGAMAVICRNRTFALHGKNTVANPWDLKVVDNEAGGIEWSIQRLGRTRYLDDRGFVSLEAVFEFGDFSTATFSQVIEPLTTLKKGLVTSSIIVKDKTQYRTFFSDGTAIIATFKDKQLSGFTTMLYEESDGTRIPVEVTANGEDDTGKEILFFGSDNGFVYQMDKGTSFDGNPVDAIFVLVYTNLGSPSYNKQFKKITIEATGSTTVSYAIRLDYASANVPAGITLTDAILSSASLWDQFFWNLDEWNSEDVSLIEGNLEGVGRTVGLQIASSGTYSQPHTLFSVTYHYIMRKLVR